MLFGVDYSIFMYALYFYYITKYRCVDVYRQMLSFARTHSETPTSVNCQRAQGNSKHTRDSSVRFWMRNQPVLRSWECSSIAGDYFPSMRFILIYVCLLCTCILCYNCNHLGFSMWRTARLSDVHQLCCCVDFSSTIRLASLRSFYRIYVSKLQFKHVYGGIQYTDNDINHNIWPVRVVLEIAD